MAEPTNSLVAFSDAAATTIMKCRYQSPSPVLTFPVRVEGDTIYIELEDR